MGITAFPFSSVIDVPSARILGRDDAGTGAAEALTNTEIFAILGTGTPSASTYLRGDGTWSTVSAGISSLNGLTDATQTFAVGATGTDVAFVSAAGIHTLNIPSASTTARGVVTTGAQSFAGDKMFASGDVRLGTGSGWSRWASGNGGSSYLETASGSIILRTSLGGGDVLECSASAVIVSNTRFQVRHAYVEGDAVDRWGHRRGTNPQAWGLYNTWTSATSFERLNIAWASNVCYIGTEKGSAGGTARDLTLGTDGAVRLVLPAATTSGALYLGPRADNTATGGNARGANAVDLQTDRNAANQVASGHASFITGYGNRATAARSFASGTSSLASADNAHALGSSCSATGESSFSASRFSTASGVGSTAVCNSNLASASSSFASGDSTQATAFASQSGGHRSIASRYCQRAHAAGWFTANGDCQSSEMILRGSTTTNAAVRLRPDGSTQRLTIASGQVCQYLLIITGVRNGGADVASYMRQVTIKNIGGTTSLVGTVNTIGVDNDAGTSLSVTADDTNDDLAIEPTGVSGQTWRWECVVYGGEIGHG